MCENSVKLGNEHPHKAIIEQWVKDIAQKVWCQYDGIGKYLCVSDGANRDLQFNPKHKYHIGDTKPKRRIKLGEFEFDEPESVVPADKTAYWIPSFGEKDNVFGCEWSKNTPVIDLRWLGLGWVHLSIESAIEHAEALIAFNKALVSK
jgi:hypothetical protein